MTKISLNIFILIISLCCQAQKNGVETMRDTLDWLPDRQDIQVGSILVPENHEAPGGSKIHITYLIIKAKDTATTRYPIVFFSGGPGVNSIDPGYVDYLLGQPVRNERDLILFDQRGTGYSSALPDMAFDAFDIMAKDANEEEELVLTKAMLYKYHSICRDRNFKPMYYNTLQSARDIGMLFKHLGYTKYNLQGISYGTLLARVVQDFYPEYIHCSVLDSPLPLGGDFLLDRLGSYSRALQKIFEYCEGNPQCKVAYPNLKSDYLKAVSILKKEPLEVNLYDSIKVYINAQDGIYLLRRLLYQNDAREKTPELIKAYIEGGGQVINDVLESEYELTGELNLTMLLSVEKFEYFNPANTSGVIKHQYEKYPLIPVKLGFFDAFYQAGMTWHTESLAIADRKFRPSDIPTLIFVNQYDPVTPPGNGFLFKETLRHGTLLILDEGGHGEGNTECKDKIITEFMNDPGKALNTSCLNLTHWE